MFYNDVNKMNRNLEIKNDIHAVREEVLSINIIERIMNLEKQYQFKIPLAQELQHYPSNEAQFFGHQFLTILLCNQYCLNAKQSVKVKCYISIKNSYMALFEKLSIKKKGKIQFFIFLLCLMAEDAMVQLIGRDKIKIRSMRICQIAYITLTYATLGIFITSSAFSLLQKRYILRKKQPLFNTAIVARFALDKLSSQTSKTRFRQSEQCFKLSLAKNLNWMVEGKTSKCEESDKNEIQEDCSKSIRKQYRSNKFRSDQTSSSMSHTHRHIKNRRNFTTIKMKPISIPLCNLKQRYLTLNQQTLNIHHMPKQISSDKSKGNIKKWKDTISKLKQSIQQLNETGYPRSYGHQYKQNSFNEIKHTQQSQIKTHKPHPTQVFNQSEADTEDIKTCQRLIYCIQNYPSVPQNPKQVTIPIFTLGSLRQQKRKFENSLKLRKSSLKMFHNLIQ